jgi:peptidoglycan/LPS O-acetylase OafA/YrhL
MAVRLWALPPLEKLGLSWQTRTLVYFVAAFLVGIAMSKLVERPLLRLRDRWFPSRADVAPATANRSEFESLPNAA